MLLLLLLHFQALLLPEFHCEDLVYFEPGTVNTHRARRRPTNSVGVATKQSRHGLPSHAFPSPQLGQSSKGRQRRESSTAWLRGLHCLAWPFPSCCTWVLCKFWIKTAMRS